MLNFAGSLALAVALFMAPSIASAQAAQAYPTQELLSTGTTVMGEALRYPTSGPAKVTVSIVTIQPGADTVLHRHPAPLVAYILEGELTVDYGAQGKKIFHKGDALLEAMDVPHRGMNHGSSPVSLLAVYLGAEGTANVALEK
ncbi:MAG: cupin domain-containing protein [Rhodocyclaceae bacterium]